MIAIPRFALHALRGKKRWIKQLRTEKGDTATGTEERSKSVAQSVYIVYSA